MNKLYYGSGSCTIETSEVVALQISYKGKIRIDDKTKNTHQIMVGDKTIIIFPLNGMDILSDLFEYKGEFRINNIIASDANANKVDVFVKGMFDYPHSTFSKPEDMTLTPEHMNAGKRYKNKQRKTSIVQKTIDNLHSNGELYLKDEPYSGAYHFHKETGQAMTGRTHTKDSVNLQVKKLKDR